MTLGIYGMMHHELWLDESHHWLLARDSVSFADLVKNTRYEGHPILWNLLLYGITRLTLNPLWMQLFHLFLAVSAVAAFLRNAPFSLAFKTLFVFGYFFFFEYFLISRNYMIGVLFLFIACSYFGKREKNFTLVCVFLALAANTHLMFTVIAFALFLTMQFEHWQDKRLLKPTYFVGTIIFIFALFIAALQIIPPSDSAFLHSASSSPLSGKFIKGFISLFKGLITVPDFRTIHFWNSNLIVNLSKPVASFFGLAAYLLPLVLFRNRKTLFFVYTALLGTQVFFFLTQLGATRYDGMTYIIFIIALWIDRYYADAFATKRKLKLPSVLQSLRNPIVYSILILHCCSGIYAYSMDFRLPFAGSKATAGLLRQNHLQDQNMVCITCEGTIISPYLDKKMFFLCEGQYCSFCQWQSQCTGRTTPNVTGLLANYVSVHGHAVFIAGRPLPKSDTSGFVSRLVGKTPESIIRNNVFYIYEITKLSGT